MLDFLKGDQAQSLIRSGLKIAGTALVAFGVITAEQLDSLMAALLQISGAVAVLLGLFSSYWHHAP